MTAVVERMRESHFADLAAAPRGPVDPSALGDHLAAMVRDAVTGNRSRHLAFMELFLESTRRPGLRAALTALRTSQIALMREIHLAAGIELTERQATMLVTATPRLPPIGGVLWRTTCGPVRRYQRQHGCWPRVSES